MLLAAGSYCQETNSRRSPADTIDMASSFFSGFRFYVANQRIDNKELKTLLKTNGVAFAQFKSANTSGAFSTILGYTGGFLIGWPIGTAIAGGKPNWALAGIGAGLTAVSIPLSISAKKKLKSAVSTYNASLN